MLGTLEDDHVFRDPMQVPYVFADDNEQAAKFAAEWLTADLVAGDTETDYDPELDLNTQVAEERVLSVFCAFKDLTDVDEDGLIGAGDLPAVLTEMGYVAAKSYVLDLGYVTVDAIDDVMRQVTMYVWNGRFERKVFARYGTRAKALEDLMLYQAALDLGAEGVRFYTGLARAAESYLDWNLEGKGGIQLSYRPVADLPELSEEQKAYAAQDAVATGLLQPLIVGACEQVTVEIDGQTRSLADIGHIESGASMFLDKMQVAGVPLALEGAEVTYGGKTYDGWLSYCDAREDAMRTAMGLIADIEHKLTGTNDAGPASQGLLPFGDESVTPVFDPSFDPGSHKQLINALNRLIPDEIGVYTVRYLGAKQPRLLTENDTVDKNALKLIGGELAEALTEWSSHNKLVNDSGRRFAGEWVRESTGRLHPNIKQCLVATGRLSMENPPMQNRPPAMKAFHRPTFDSPETGRVVVYADLSQAELRTLAHMARDEKMTQAFVNGEDLHTVTATEMFELDIAAMNEAHDALDEALIELVEANRIPVPEGRTELDGDDDDVITVGSTAIARSSLVEAIQKFAKLNRGKAKVPNFGVPYGMSPARLALTLCLQGVDTTSEQGRDILDRWMNTYQGVKQWLEDRDAYIDTLAANPPACDYDATWKLIDWHKPVTDAKFALKRRLGRFPTPTEIAGQLHTDEQIVASLRESLERDPTDEELAEERQARVAFVKWVLSFRVPVVVAQDGTPFAFASRTLGGRRRLFQVGMAQWLESQAVTIVRSEKDGVIALRDQFAAQYNLRLSNDGKPLGFFQARKAVPKNLQPKLVRFVLERMPAGARNVLGQMGLSDSIKAKKQQFRNAPIQGTVGDAVLYAYKLLDERLEVFGDRVRPVLTVHDSIMLEADAGVAREVAKVLQATMEEGLHFYCPTVPAVADAAILHSFDEDDVVADELLDQAEAAELQQAA